MPPRSLFSTMISAAVLAATFAAGPALAAKQMPEAADQTLGTALLSARLDSYGNLHGGAGVTGVAHPSTGVYIVTFSRSVVDCAYSGTAGFWAPVSAPDAFGHVSVQPYDGNANSVIVGRGNAAGLSADGSFHLLVLCTN